MSSKSQDDTQFGLSHNPMNVPVLVLVLLFYLENSVPLCEIWQVLCFKKRFNFAFTFRHSSFYFYFLIQKYDNSESRLPI